MAQGRDDFRVHIGFFGHVKTKKLRHALGTDGVLGLLRLWAYAADNHPEGALAGMGPDDVECAADWTGKRREFVASLVEFGLLDVDDDGSFALHDWAEHQGWVSKRTARTQASLKANKVRWDAERKRKAADRMRALSEPDSDSEKPDSDSEKPDSAPSEAEIPPSLPFPAFPSPSLPLPTPPGGAGDGEAVPPAPSGAPAVKQKRKPTFAERMGGKLATALGSSKTMCQRQIRALLNAGWTEEQVTRALSHAMPGMPPWDWTAKVQRLATGDNLNAEEWALLADEMEANEEA